MNALWVIHYPVFGGPHNKALRLAPYLKRHGWTSMVLLPDEPGNAAGRLEASGIPVIRTELSRLRRTANPWSVGSFLWHSPADLRRLRSVIQREQVDVVVVTGLANPQAAFAAAKSRVPVVWQVLDTRLPMAARRLLMRLVERFADVAMFDGPSLLEAHHVSAELRRRAFIYYPPVDTKQFVPSITRRMAGRQRLGIPADAPVIGMVANLNPQKGIEYFIRAASLIRKGRDDVYFLLIGAEYRTHHGYSKMLRSEIRRGGLSDRLLLTGNVSDVENYLPVMDIKTITSVPRSEGTTTTALEAMACGVPVVTTRVGAIPDVVEDGVTGVIVPPKDPNALAEAWASLVADKRIRCRLGSQGRSRALLLFDVERCADTHLEALQAAVAKKGAAPTAGHFLEQAPAPLSN